MTTAIRAGSRRGPVLGLLALLAAGAMTSRTGAQGAAGAAETVRSADGVPIAYERHGQGDPALVFVHGWSYDRGYWSGQLEPFARRFTVVAVDLAGHGDSGLGRKAQTMTAFGRDVAAVAEKLNLKRTILVGHSMGGDVIVEAARLLKGRVAGLIWVDAYQDLDNPLTPEQLRAWIDKLRADFPGTTRTAVRGMFPPDADTALVERVANDMASAPPTVAIPALEDAFNYAREVPEALRELALPVVAINGEAEPTSMASMKKHGIEVLMMPGVGHFLMMEDPGRFNSARAQEESQRRIMSIARSSRCTPPCPGSRLQELSVTANRLFFNLGETTGNIWMAEWKP